MDSGANYAGHVNFLETDKKLVLSKGLQSRHSSELKPKELRILLIGKTGDGKSSSANTILGRKEFKASLRAKSETQNCQFATTERFGRKIVVVDTPGLCDTKFAPDVIRKELIRSVGYASPGFHAIIFVLAAGRYTDECITVRDQFFDWFGEDVRNYCLILITRGDEFEDSSDREGYLKEIPSAMHEFIEACDKRCMFFNNKATGDENDLQISELIKRVDAIIEQNKGQYFSNIAFRLAKTFERVSNSPIYKWVLKKVEALKVDPCPKTKEGDHITDGSAGAEEEYSIEKSSSDENSPAEEIRRTGSDDGDHDLDSFLEKEISSDPIDESQMSTNSTENEDENAKLRQTLKKPGIFDKFMMFFSRTYDKLVLGMLKKETAIKFTNQK